MKKRSYIPERGDLVWLDFAPQAGHEPAGRRPAMILSVGAYNGRTGLAVCCPVTSQVKGYPFEVALPARGKISGVVLADQVKSLDWKARNAEFAGSAPVEAVQEALRKLAAIIQFS